MSKKNKKKKRNVAGYQDNEIPGNDQVNQGYQSGLIFVSGNFFGNQVNADGDNNPGDTGEKPRKENVTAEQIKKVDNPSGYRGMIVVVYIEILAPSVVIGFIGGYGKAVCEDQLDDYNR